MEQLELAKCDECGCEIPGSNARYFVIHYCDECKEEREAKRKLRIWEEVCPRRFLETDREHDEFPKDRLEELLKIDLNQEGFGLVGVSGACKTRLVWEVLRDSWFESTLKGNRRTITAGGLARIIRTQYTDEDAVKQLKTLFSVDLLFIDDIGKQKFTEAVEAEFFELLDHRYANKLPVIWTANAETPGDIRGMLSADRGEPMINRLKSFGPVFRIEKKN